jgi:hypothetical protein
LPLHRHPLSLTVNRFCHQVIIPTTTFKNKPQPLQRTVANTFDVPASSAAAAAAVSSPKTLKGGVKRVTRRTFTSAVSAAHPRTLRGITSTIFKSKSVRLVSFTKLRRLS